MVAGLKKGNEVLNQIHKEMNIADVEKLMDDTQEAIEYQNVFSDISYFTILIIKIFIGNR
jgi:charged multivesicular body protein 6